MCGALFGSEKSSISDLRVSDLEIDHAGEMAGKVRVVGVEALRDELGMGVVLGEDDRLAEPVAVLDLDAVRHQVLEHLVDGVGVEQPLVERGRVDCAGDGAVVVPFERVPCLLLLVGQFVVADAAVEELQRHRDRLGRHEKAVRHRLVETVGVGRHAGLQIEQPIGVAVDLVLSASRSGRPAGCRNSRRSPCISDRPSGAPRRSRSGRNGRRRSGACRRRLRRSGPSWSDRSRRRRGLPASCRSSRLTGAAPGRCALKALTA